MPAPAAYDPNKQFDVARRRAAEAERSNLQQSKDALARRAAQLGGGPGGALIKAEQNAEDASAKRLASANEGIDAAQGAEMGRRQEIMEARQFQTSERLGSQKFASGERAAQQNFSAAQAEAQRKWQTGERMSAQDWQALQAKDQREWQTGERLGSQEFAAEQRQAAVSDARFDALTARNWQRRENELNRAMQESQFGEQMRLAWDQFSHEKYVDQFNMDLSRDVFEEKDFLERMLSGGGGGFMKSPWGKANTGWQSGGISTAVDYGSDQGWW